MLCKSFVALFNKNYLLHFLRHNIFQRVFTVNKNSGTSLFGMHFTDPGRESIRWQNWVALDFKHFLDIVGPVEVRKLTYGCESAIILTFFLIYTLFKVWESFFSPCLVAMYLEWNDHCNLKQFQYSVTPALILWKQNMPVVSKVTYAY